MAWLVLRCAIYLYYDHHDHISILLQRGPGVQIRYVRRRRAGRLANQYPSHVHVHDAYVLGTYVRIHNVRWRALEHGFFAVQRGEATA